MRHALNNEERQLKKSIISRIAIISVIGVILGLLAVSTLGWFADVAGGVNATGMSVALKADGYDILVERKTEYDTAYSDGTKRGYTNVTNSGGL